MIKTSGKYSPDIAIPPGETLLEVIKSRDISQKELADRTGLTTKTINLIIKGIAPITPETALKLEIVLDMPASFWFNLENNYQETLLRLKLEKESETEKWIVDEIDYAELVKLDWIPKASSLSEKISNLKKYFGITSFNNIKTLYPALFRKSCGKNSSHYALAAWIEKGLKEASKIETKKFDKNFLKINIYKFKELTLENDPNKFIPELLNLCKDCGIAFLILPHLKRTYAHGATKWITPDKALLLLSLRFRFIDIFWFSFFHELGHIIYHSKKDIFIECDNNPDKFEDEANEFAADTLINPKEYKDFIKNNVFIYDSILKFSERIGVNPAIVIGRLEHENLINYGAYDSLKPRLKFVEN